MSCRGVYFALTGEEKEKLLSFDRDQDRIAFVQEEIEENWDEDHLIAVDKAWDPIHRILGEFPPNADYFYPVKPESGDFALPEDHGSYPLKQAVLGGRKITDDESQYFIRLVEPDAVSDLAQALAPIEFDWFAEKYKHHCPRDWAEYGEDDLQYSWDYFCEMRDFYTRMAGNGRAVIFTADQ